MSERTILEQSIEDHKKAIDKAETELEKLELTYSIGDRFVNEQSGKYLLSKVWSDGGERVFLSSMSDGTPYGINLFRVDDTHRITPKEMERICHTNGSFIKRYWNSQKGCEE